MAQLTIRDLSFSYPDAENKALDAISFTLHRGELMTVIGPTGSGKSTLLRLLKPQLRLQGTLEGVIQLDGADIASLSNSESARRIGFVAQNPEEQIVTDQVWHELAFTLENLGAKPAEIARRVADVGSFFGIEGWYRRETATLSGGQKQLLNLASVITADPQLLLLDEPTAQLDPIAAARFIDTVHRLCRETGLSVIITEHRCEQLIPLSDRVLVLDQGRMIACDSPRAVAGSLKDSVYRRFLPCAAQLYAATGGEGDPPLTIGEGQRDVQERFLTESLSPITPHEPGHGAPALELNSIFFRYERSSPDVLRDLSLTVYSGEILALLGANGAGKTTLANVAAALSRPYSGRIRLFSKKPSEYKNSALYGGCLSLLPQDVESVFLHATVREELKGCEAALSRLPFDLTPLFDRHPYDLSGGERQLVALCKALRCDPRLLILDEPSKGLDPLAKEQLAQALLRLKDDGVTVLLISHDVDFAALCADRCALFFDGAVAACEPTAAFLSGNRFYTTPCSRMTRPYFSGGYTVARAAERLNTCGRRL